MYTPIDIGVPATSPIVMDEEAMKQQIDTLRLGLKPKFLAANPTIPTLPVEQNSYEDILLAGNPVEPEPLILDANTVEDALLEETKMETNAVEPIMLETNTASISTIEKPNESDPIYPLLHPKFPVTDEDYYVSEPWVKIYEERYLDPHKTYTAVVATPGRIKACGCETALCTTMYMKTQPVHCGYCKTPMRQKCTSGQGEGCCRQCFLKYWNSKEDGQSEEKSTNNTFSRNNQGLLVYLSFPTIIYLLTCNYLSVCPINR